MENNNSNNNNNKFPEDMCDIKDRAARLESLINLSNELRDKERRVPITFNDFLYLASIQPELVFRDIFQLFHDMVHHYIPDAEDDFHYTDESIGFKPYDPANLFVSGCDNPFFADRLFTNRFMNMVDGLRKGTQNTNIFLYEGPPGSGKSTFLNNMLQKLEDYAKTEVGTTFKVYWRLDIKALGGFQKFEGKNHAVAETAVKLTQEEEKGNGNMKKTPYPEKYLEFSCPNHDHPILLIPKSYRKRFLDELITDDIFRERIYNEKQYEWVLKDIPCNICNSLYKSLLDQTGDPLTVFSMIYARKNFFSRQFGEGISVFNPGDMTINKPIANPTLQHLLNELFQNDDINFLFSYLAKTNNGVLALMDIMEYNVDRLKAYHGIISDGVHKVELTEEHIKTLFLGLVNPEDKVHYEKVKSFQDRIVTVNIPYILDYNTEVAIYKNKFGDRVTKLFLPRVLENFAKIIISTRLEKNSTSIKKWIKNPEKYNKYMDKNQLLLKMDIYTGKIPTWISEEDLKKFDRKVRKEIIEESEIEGSKGFSGRQSLMVLGRLLSKYEEDNKMITMDMLKSFFSEKKEIMDKEVPEGFIDSLEDMYNYNVLQEVKEAIYYYNEEHISRDIQNYLFAINFEPGETKKSDYTGDIIEISEEFFKNFEALFLGTTSTERQRQEFRRDIQSEYITQTLFQEIRNEGKPITETVQFKTLFEKYTRNLKENALAPYLDNDNFRRAIQDFGSETFNSYDGRMRRDIEFLIGNLKKKFGYTEEGAKGVSLYVLDKGLAKKY